MSELHPQDILDALEKGTLAENLKDLIAAGFLPIPAQDMVPLLVFLIQHEKGERKERAGKTLQSLPSLHITRYCQSQEARPFVLGYFLFQPSHEGLIPTLLEHPHTPIDALKAYCHVAPPKYQALILQQVQRIVDHPELLEALEANEALTPASKGRIQEIRFHYFQEALPEEEVVEEEKPEEAPTLSAEAQALFEEFGVEPEGENLFSEIAFDIEECETEEEKTLYQKILTMSVPQKIDLAIKGNKEARGILIRDSNKLVQAAVIKSPKITDSEAASIAAMRHLDTELMRYITQQRQWTRKYQVVRNLVFNPKTPIGEALTLMNRLTKRDLKELSRDKGVSDVVRTAALRLYRTRMSSSR